MLTSSSNPSFSTTGIEFLHFFMSIVVVLFSESRAVKPAVVVVFNHSDRLTCATFSISASLMLHTITPALSRIVTSPFACTVCLFFLKNNRNRQHVFGLKLCNSCPKRELYIKEYSQSLSELCLWAEKPIRRHSLHRSQR